MAVGNRLAPWSLFEVIERGADGQLKIDEPGPFSAALLSGGDPLETPLGKMDLLRHHGWPDAISAMKSDKGKPLLERADDLEPPIWILKTKPSCWRLYFYVDTTHGRFIFLDAKCKKKTRRNANHCQRARNIRSRIGGTAGSGIVAFELPD